MTEEEYGKRYTDLVRLYRSSPASFSPDDVDQIEYIAKTLGRRFARDPQAAEETLGKQVGDVIGQFTSGLVSGFTTIPIGDDPEDIPEAIARSIGQLGGFLGYVPGLGMATKAGAMASARVLTKTAGLTAKTSPKAFKAAMQGRRAVKQFDTAIRQPGALMGKSIPMMVGKKATEYAKKYVLPPVNDQARKYFSKGVAEGLEDSFETAVQLGAASAISSWTGGVDQIIRGGLFGAIEGGVFRGITNATQLGQMITKGGKEAKRANLAIRTISSSIYGGMQSKTFGDPIELQIYHYLLGAFFGVTDVPFAQRKAIEFVNKSMDLSREEAQAGLTERMLNPELNPGFKDLSKEVQEEVIDQLDQMFGKPGDARAIFGESLRQVLSEESKENIVREFARKKFEEFADSDENLTFEEAKQKTYDFIKDKDFSRLISSPEFYLTMNDGVKAEYDPQKGVNLSNKAIVELSFFDHEIPTVLQDPLLRWAENSIPDQPELVNSLTLDSGKIIDASIKEGRSFEEAIKGVKNNWFAKTGNFLPESKESINLLKKSFKKLSHQKRQKILIYDGSKTDDTKPFFTESDGNLSDFRSINEFKADSAVAKAVKRLIPHTKNNIFLSKYTDTGKVVSTLSKNFFKITQDAGYDLDMNEVNNYVIRAGLEGKPVIAGIKDSGKIVHANDWNFDDSNNAWLVDFAAKVEDINRIDDSLGIKINIAEINPATDGINNPELVEIKMVQDKYTYNNIRLLEELNGLPIQDIVRYNKQDRDAGRKERFITKPEDINKRMQPLSDGNPPLSKEVGNIRAAIVKSNDAQHYLKLLDLDETNNDGIILVSSNMFKKIANDIGADENKDGFLKFTIAGQQGDGKGMIIGKLGAFKASKKTDPFLKKNKIDFLMFDTAVKQAGLRDISTLKFTKEGISIAEEGGLQPFNIDPETVRINLNVYEKMPEDTRLVKQFVSLMDTPESIERLTKNIIRVSLDGNAETNKLIQSQDFKNTFVADINIDDISIENIVNILFQPKNSRAVATPLYNKVWSHIFNQKSAIDFEDPADLKGETGDIDHVVNEILVDRFNGGQDRLIKVALAKGELSPVIMNRPEVASYANEALKRYIYNRAIRPKVKNSGSVFIYGNDYVLQNEIARPVARDTYMLAESMKDFKIKWIDGTQMKMGKAWEIFQKETDAAKKKQMEDALEFIVVRVPQDSPSGARVLKFAGFTPRSGYGMHLNAYDMKYLGGADNDGDKVHFYQDLDGDLGGSPIKDAVRKFAREYDTPDGGVKDPTEGDLTVVKPKYNLKNGLDPVSLLATHMYTTDASGLVGPIANAGATSLGIKGLINSNSNIQKFIGSDGILRPVSVGKGLPFAAGLRITKIDGTLKEYNAARRQLQNLAIDAIDKIDINVVNQGLYLSQKYVKDFELIDVNNRTIKVSPAVKEKFRSRLNINKIEGADELVRINEVINGRRFNRETNQSEIIKFDTGINSIINFGIKYKNVDLKSGYYRAIKELSKSVQNYRPINKATSQQTTDETMLRTYSSDFSRAIRFDLNNIFDIVNAYLKDGKDSQYANVLLGSSMRQFSILDGSLKRDRKFSTIKSVYKSIDNLASISLNRQAFVAARRAGISDKKLADIRLHIDSVKYTRSLFFEKDINESDAIRKRLIKDKELKITEIENLDDLIKVTEKYHASLKTKAEKDYYDMYMIGSVSEQRFNIDDVARAVYITKKNNVTFNTALNLMQDSKYDKYTYEYLSSDEYKSTEKILPLKNIASEIDRVFQNKSGDQNFGLSLDHVDNNNVSKYVSLFNEIAQVKEGTEKIYSDVINPAASATVEKILLKNVSKEKREELNEILNEEIKREYRSPIEPGTIPSVNTAFDIKLNTSRPPIDDREARRSSVNDEVITEKFSEDLINEIAKDDPTKTFTETDQQLIDQLTVHLSKLPSNVVEDINRVYQSRIRKDIGVSTKEDVRDFVRYLNSFHSKTFLEKLVGADPTQGISRIYWAFFPDSIARRLTSIDTNLSEDQIVQVLTTEGYKNKKVKDVMSHYEMMRLSLNTVEEARSALVNRITGAINNELNYLNDESVINDRENLIETSIAIKEMGNIGRLRRLKDKVHQI